jgi:wyosine [tRNA(Phe)-imidazoG37] synthetase (radical SAM superfamily)
MNKDNHMSAPLLIGPTTEAPHRLLADKPAPKSANAFSSPRDFLENRFVYFTLSPRARGLSIGINVNPDRKCNFDCIYCEVDRAQPMPAEAFDPEAAALELENALRQVHTGYIQHLPPYSSLPPELLKLKHVALSGDGEPTLSPKFLEAVEMVAHVRARGHFPFFKIVLITNASGLDKPEALLALNLFTPRDEIWAKLDAGSNQRLANINHADVPLEKILANILLVARRRPVIVQSLFCKVDDAVPSIADIEDYATRLKELKEAGAQIPLVQIYSATRPIANPLVRHLPLRSLSDIAEAVRRIAGLNAEPF